MDSFIAAWPGFGPLSWLALGAVLLAAELLTGTAYLLWIAAAAALTAALIAVFPDLGIAFQLVAFACLAMSTTVIGKRFFSPMLTPSQSPGLNLPILRHLGQTAVSVAPFVGGEGRVRIGDTEWAAKTDDLSSPKEGAVVVVTGVEGAIMHVKAVD
jgi:membrane protein implicated in regulation of membrane protease activity